jgi:hypothetical protein
VCPAVEETMSNPPLPSLRQRDAQALAAGYSRQMRWVEICAILTFFGFMVALGVKLWTPTWQSPWLVLTAVLLGYLAADFISGFVHWSADTWGDVDMPVLGKNFLRPFREHHVDQKAITHHDFIETNGSNCLVSLLPAVAAMFIPVHSTTSTFAVAFLTSLILWVFATNQFHKWSHMEKPPPVVAWLQKLHLVLPPAHHALHHTAPFNKYYCITVGWMNWPLYKMRFFPSLEWMVTACTGMLPRKDDIGEEAARAISPSTSSSGIEAETRIP